MMISASTPPEGAEAPCNPGTSAEAPVFLVGALRSGTTAMRLMLDGHPELSLPFEFDFAVDNIAPDGSYPDVSQFLEHLSTHRIFLATGLTSNPALSFPELVCSYLNQARSRSGKRLIGATVHRDFDRLARIWPDARFIHLLRDGRDVARSVVRMGWAGNAFVGAGFWLDTERSWDRLAAQVSPAQLHEVRYEHLLRRPVTTLKGICEFLGIDYHPFMLRYSERSTYSAPSPLAVLGWRGNPQARREARLAEFRLGALLQMRGYGLSGPYEDLSKYRRAYLSLDSRVRTWLFRVRRQGPGLMAMDVATRRFPLVPRHVRRVVQRQLNRVEHAYLK